MSDYETIYNIFAMSPITLTHFHMNDASLKLDFSPRRLQEITYYLHTPWNIVFIEDSLIELSKTIESYQTTTLGCKKLPNHAVICYRVNVVFSGKCSAPTSASLRHHGLLAIFSRCIEKTCPNSFAKQHSSAKSPFPTTFFKALRD